MITSRLGNRGRWRPGRPSPGNLSGVSVKRHNNAVCPFLDCPWPRRSISRPGDALSGERHRQALAIRFCHGISRLQRFGLDRRRRSYVIAQPPVLIRQFLFPRPNCITLSSVWISNGRPGAAGDVIIPTPPNVFKASFPWPPTICVFFRIALDIVCPPMLRLVRFENAT